MTTKEDIEKAAEEYAAQYLERSKLISFPSTRLILENSFLAGYEAAKKQTPDEAGEDE